MTEAAAFLTGGGMSSISPAVWSFESEALDDEEEPVDVTEACEPRGEEPLLAGDARLGDRSDEPCSWVARLWTDRRRSDRMPALPTGV